MSKRGYISRYLLILKKLKAKPYSTFEELRGYIENQIEYLQVSDENLNIGFSKRTLQRDMREINNIFGVEIEYSTSQKGYFINQTESEHMNFQRMIEAFELFNSLKLADDLAPFVYTEKRKPQGIENLYGLLHAIRNKFRITFSYQKFWDTEPGKRTVEPYALKEFRNRWYLLARDIKDETVKSFALDRLTVLEISNRAFGFPKTFNIEENYHYCFGIIGPNCEKPQEIILSFDPFQGKYIKSLPLHETQEILIDNKDEVRIRLTLYLTFDFVMELLSFGDNVKVIKPVRLAKEVKKAHKDAFEQY